MTKQTMITTMDNPFSPFDNYVAWNNWDIMHGYHTSALLARVVVTSDEISEEDQNSALREGMDEIVSNNLSGVHILVSRDA